MVKKEKNKTKQNDSPKYLNTTISLNQKDPIKIKNLFFKGKLAKIGSSKYWWWPVVPLSLVVDTPMLSDSNSNAALFPNYCIHKIF